MSAFVIFDVEIRDPERYQDFMRQVKPALEAAGAKYLARGGATAGQRRRASALRCRACAARRPTPPSSGQLPAGCACLQLPLMSNVREL
jgi:hypothetical protein